MKKLWQPLQERIVYEDPVLKIRRKDYFYETAKASMTFTVADMNDWAIIIPITCDGDFIIVSQFRIGFEKDTLEFPGGSVNKSEAPTLAASRELTEETGATADSITLLGVMEPNPAFMSNKCSVFLAEGCKFNSQQNLDKFEDAAPITVSPEQLRQMIKSGEFSQSVSLAALGLYFNAKADIA